MAAQPVTSSSGAYGAPSAQRQPLTLQGVYQARCFALALERDWADAARYIGRAPDGSSRYTVPSATYPGRVYTVSQRRDASRDIYPADGVWRCQCRAGSHGGACRHTGAAMLLAAQRAEIVDAVAAARAAGMTIASARYMLRRADGCHIYRVEREAQTWECVTTIYDPRDGRGVGRYCGCGKLACPHLGAVAMQVAARR